MYCPKCGAENLPGAVFCKQCGEKLQEAAQGTSGGGAGNQEPYEYGTGAQGASGGQGTTGRGAGTAYQTPPPYTPQNDYQGYVSPDQIPPEYKPISMWGYFGYEILFSIPIVGFILLIIFAIAAPNRNVKNFARSYFCLLIIVVIILLIVGATAGFGALFRL